MKVVLVEVAIWAWWTAMVLSIGWACPLMADQEKDSTTLQFVTIPFDTEHGTQESYKTFIRDLRNQLTGSEVVNIPVLRDPAKVPDNQRFLLVRLQASQEIFVSLVVDVTTLYVLGYVDRYQGRDRTQFFKDDQDKAIPLAKRLVFPRAPRLEIPYGISYGDMEREAGTKRQGIPLGIKNLQDAVKSVFGLPPAQTPEERKERNMIEAKFLLIAIQMVSEAARFKYLENKIRQTGKVPDDCVIGLELVWTKISKAIQNVETLNTGDKLDSCPGLEGLRGDQLKREIIQQSYMGILKYKVDGLYAISTVSRIVNNCYTILIGIFAVIVILLVGIYLYRSKDLKQHKA